MYNTNLTNPPTAATSCRILLVFTRIWAGFGLLLFASTWKLWTPQTEFPQIPFFEFLIDTPGWVDWVALALIGLSLGVCLVARSRNWITFSLWLFVVASTVSILLNQHRLQPWAYQFAIFAIIMATTTPKAALFWMRWIVISIYVYSAISKFDYQFIHTVGDQMLSAWFEKLGLDTGPWSETMRNRIVLAFPIFELLIGVGLMVPLLRRFAVFGAVLMHLALLAALIGNVDGPGVLIWNVFFVVQAVFLFGWSPTWETISKAGKNEAGEAVADQDPTLQSRSRSPMGSAATAVALIVLVFPLTQPLGICDHWPAWQVYAPRTSRARIKEVIENHSEWNHISHWSVSTLQVPVYPQARFQLAVVMAAQEKFPNAKGRSVEVASESNRWTGARETATLKGDQVKMHAERYWLNLKPRKIWTGL